MKSLTIFSIEASPAWAWLMAALLFVLPLSAGCDSSAGGEEEVVVVPSLRVTTVTDGKELDADGYTVMVNGTQEVTIGPNETVLVPQITSGNHVLDLDGVNSNCTAESITHSVSVTGPTEVTFTVNCILKGRIAFTCAQPGAGGGNQNLCVARPDGSERIRLTSGGGMGAPTFSHDGSKIVYPKTSFLWVIDADGGEPTQLTYSIDVVDPHDPIWSPDDSKIAFSGRHLDAFGVFIGTRNIYVMDADGSNIVKLTNNNDLWLSSPSWSPDGSQLAFTGGPEENPTREEDWSDIYVMNADGTDLRNITESTPLSSLINHINWSPVDSRIVFSAAPSPELKYAVFTTYMIDANGANLKQLSRTGEQAHNPTWRPDGEWLVYYGEGINPDGGFCENGGTLAIMNPDGFQREFITDCSMRDQAPSWTLGEGQ